MAVKSDILITFIIIKQGHILILYGLVIKWVLIHRVNFIKEGSRNLVGVQKKTHEINKIAIVVHIGKFFFCEAERGFFYKSIQRTEFHKNICAHMNSVQRFYGFDLTGFNGFVPNNCLPFNRTAVLTARRFCSISTVLVMLSNWDFLRVFEMKPS